MYYVASDKYCLLLRKVTNHAQRVILFKETRMPPVFDFKNTFIDRTLRDCIYGVVRHGVTLEQREGFYRYRLDRQVAIKCMSKSLITRQRGRIREDPISELSLLQLLSTPGHLHVQKLLECIQDTEHIYSICPFYPGGELFSFIENRGSGLAEDQARSVFLQVRRDESEKRSASSPIILIEAFPAITINR